MIKTVGSPERGTDLRVSETIFKLCDSLSPVEMHNHLAITPRTFERRRINGFTLLEIMLVMVLLGIAISATLPSLMPDDSGALIKKEARRLVMLTQTVQEQALVNGQDMAMQQTPEGYQFLVYQHDQWQPLTGQRLLVPVVLSNAIKLTILPGESVWRDSLEQERDKGFTFEDSSSDAENEPKSGPGLYFWASGEISPAELLLYPASNPKASLSILVDDHGAIYQAEELQQ